MGAEKPSYEELEARLDEAVRMLTAISNESVDALIGKQGVYLLRLNEVEKALKAERARLETVLEQLPEGVIIAEARSEKLIYHNAQVERIWRHDFVASEGIDHDGRDRSFHPDGSSYRPEDWPLARTMATGEIVESEEIKFQRGDGSLGWMTVSSVPIRDEKGDLVAGVATFSDSTERRQIEENLRENNRELAEYAYALTHNLKEPLRAIRNYVDFLFEDLADALEGEPKRYLEGIRESIVKSQRQFQDLEALYGIKNHPLNFEAVDMKELVDELHVTFRDTPGCQLVSQEDWPVLNGERHLLGQILSHLIDNGFKYNRMVLKRVEVGWQKAPENRIEIFVRDNGIGIEPRFHEDIFRIFKRLHTEREYGGTGIGLAIVRRAAQKIGGSLRVESALGRGSTFYVSLPESILESGRKRPSTAFSPADGFPPAIRSRP